MNPADLSLDQQRDLLKHWLDHPAFCQSLSIELKSGELVRMPPTAPSQAKLNAAIAKQRAQGKPVRIRALKARQVYWSTNCATHVFKGVAFAPGQKAKVYAHLDETTRQLYRYYEIFDETYSGHCGIRKRPTIRKQFGDLIEYEGGGRIEFGSAETQRGGRGSPFKFLHLSETAFWQRAAALRTGLLNSVPMLPDTMVLDESTANGAGGDFYDGWLACEDPNNSGEWIGVFFGCHEHPENRLPVRDVAAFQKSLDDEEYKIWESFRVPFEFLAWRRVMITGPCEGDVRRFWQEHPMTPSQAFLTSGRPRFDVLCLQRMPVRDAELQGNLEEQTIGFEQKVIMVPRADGTGLLRVWKRPEKGGRYVIGSDTAEGIDAKDGKGTADPDFSVSCVLNRNTGEQVAVMRGRIEPHEFAVLNWRLMRYYHMACINPEAKNTGSAFIMALLSLGVPGALIYRSILKRQTTHPLLQDFGFVTSAVSRPQLISQADKVIRELSAPIVDKLTISELTRFVYWPDGHVAAQQGAHDDCCFAYFLAIECLEYALHADRIIEASQAASRSELEQQHEVITYGSLAKYIAHR